MKTKSKADKYHLVHDLSSLRIDNIHISGSSATARGKRESTQDLVSCNVLVSSWPVDPFPR